MSDTPMVWENVPVLVLILYALLSPVA